MNITKSDCEAILSKELEGRKFSFIDFSITKCGDFLGFIGEYYKLDVTADVEGKVRSFYYFVKSLPTNEREREILSEQGFHKKENSVYREIFSKFIPATLEENDRWCPTFFMSKEDVLVLEDLSKKGYKNLPFRYKFTKAHLEESLKALAKFHSCSIVYEEKIHRQKLGKVFEEILIDKGFVAENPWLQTGFKVVEAVAKTKTKFKNSPECLENFQQKLHELLHRMYEPKVCVLKVLSHSDVWKNNLMFKFDQSKTGFETPTHCLLLDFQIVKYLPLPIDALMAVILNTRRDDHNERLQCYLKFYYDSLADEVMKSGIDLESKITFKDFREACNYFKLVAVIYNAISIMITHIPTEFFVQIPHEEYEEFSIRDRTKTVFKFMEEDKFYRDCVVEAVEEIIEYHEA